MSLPVIAGNPPMDELVVDAMIERFKLIAPPLYLFDIEGRVFDVYEAPSEVQLPCVIVTCLPEEVKPADASTGGRYECVLPILVEFFEAWHEAPEAAPSTRKRYANRFRSDVRRAGKAGTNSGDLSVLGSTVQIREKSSSVLLGGANDSIEGEVLFHATYWRNHLDDRVH